MRASSTAGKTSQFRAVAPRDRRDYQGDFKAHSMKLCSFFQIQAPQKMSFTLLLVPRSAATCIATFQEIGSAYRRTLENA